MSLKMKIARKVALWSTAWAKRHFKGMELVQVKSGIAAVYGALDLYGAMFASTIFLFNAPRTIRAAYRKRGK